MTSYPAGTRARVTFVGTFDDLGRFVIDTSDAVIRFPSTGLDAAERVEVIEPDWQPGDIVLDADGEVYQYDPQEQAPKHFPWRHWLGRCSDHMVIRPLTLLARDGKAVPPPEQPQ